MTSVSSASILSRPQIANPTTVNQDIILYSFDSYYPNTKNKKNKSQINENPADAATRRVTPTESKNRILIVDDEPDIARLFKLGLEREGGFEVDVYNDPMIALSNYRPGIYVLLLLDIKMRNEWFRIISKLKRKRQKGEQRRRN